ncbi:hypothetical protein [Saccharothrix violaceirubra]|nr:hypothetical protein [Saccharothrix violaceirubra]
MARLVAHEVDHLRSVLCRDHLPIPIEQYRGTGRTSDYNGST